MVIRSFHSVSGLGDLNRLYTSNYHQPDLLLNAIDSTAIIMSVEEGLVSTDISVIKQARGVAKGMVTKCINSLDIALVQDADGGFIFDEIDQTNLGEIHMNLLSNYERLV